MRLKRIYSSKLYVTSTRKDRIHAAIQDPINAELVQQLSEYLDDSALKELRQAEKEIKSKQEAEKSDNGAGGDAGAGGSDSFTSSGSNGSFTPPAFSGDPLSDFGEDELPDIDLPDEGGESGGEDSAPDEAIESVTQEGKKITATSVIWTTQEDISKECSTIQGTLNAREDTNGVTRMEVKNDGAELWIYYGDDSNLNDKMIEVISVLNSTGYTYLKFNRLARSNNAIVFDVNLNASDNIKSVKDIEEETK